MFSRTATPIYNELKEEMNVDTEIQEENGVEVEQVNDGDVPGTGEDDSWPEQEDDEADDEEYEDEDDEDDEDEEDDE